MENSANSSDDQRKVARLIVVFLGVMLLVTRLYELEDQLQVLERKQFKTLQAVREMLIIAATKTPAPPTPAPTVETEKPRKQRHRANEPAPAQSYEARAGISPEREEAAAKFSALLEEATGTTELDEDGQKKNSFEVTPMPPPPQNIYDTLPPSTKRWPAGDPNHGFRQTDTKPLVAILSINAQVGGGGGGAGGQRGLYSKSSWIYPMSFHNKNQFARKWGYDLIIEDNAIVDRSRDVAWSKIPALKKWLPNYQWIMWMDMDAFFMRFDMDIEHILTEDVDFIIGKDWHGINMGVFFMRNSPYSFELLDELWTTPKDKWYPWEEQSALMHILQQGQTKAAFVHTKHFSFPPLRDFNSYPGDFAFGHKPSKYVKGDFIAHFPNCKSVKNCRESMTAMFEDMMTENMLPQIPNNIPSHIYPEEH